MRLGIDFGTTHTVAALVDRGNYPIVGYEWGDAVPSVFAVRKDGAIRYGQPAEEVALDPDWRVERSFKRLLREAGPLTELEANGRRLLLADVLAGYLAQLRRDIATASNVELDAEEPLEVAVSVPANASNDQRFLTLDSFQRAGFEVLALLNEPSAAGFEYGHRFRRTVTSKREYVLVYDLGGGTFDASLIHMTGLVNEVIASSGVPRLGGDDFDEAILALILKKTHAAEPAAAVRRGLLDLCRQQKEAVSPNTRRLLVDLALLGKPALAVPMDEVSDAIEPFVDHTLQVMNDVLDRPGHGREAVSVKELAGIYVVGGASSFPLVARKLKETFGAQRVRRSPHPFAAAAIGLGCYLDEDAGFQLSDCLSRHFGVWREASAGHEVSFDPIFPRDTRLPGPKEPPLVAVRHYRPAHNLGHFRYVECGAIREGKPDGNVTPWDGIWFPFDRSLRERSDLGGVPVVRLPAEGPLIEEKYECTTAGMFQVTLTCLDDGYRRSFRIARHAGTPPPEPEPPTRHAHRTRGRLSP